MLRFLRAGWLALMAVCAFGLIPSDAAAQSCLGGIDGLVWLDANGNGLRDPAEGSMGINGVTLELRNSSGTLLATRTTGAAVGSIPGTYQFSFLCAGTYTVTLVSGVPAGYVPTISPPGADPNYDSDTSPTTVTIITGQKEHAVNFGFVTGCTGSIGDRVWNDLNQNGVQDGGEAGMAGVPVRLLLNGAVVASTTTDANGNYNFGNLCPGNYTVEVDTPAGFTPSPTFGTPDTALDSNASGVVVPLGLNEHNPTIDFGFFAPCTGRIGDRVWFDTNRDGIQNAGELGIAGVTVELLNSGGSVVASTITDGAGNYLFTGLCAGTYSVRVVAATLPAGVVPSDVNAPGSTTANDSNPNPSTVVLPASNSSDLTIDFGYYTPCTGKIGDFVWNDANGNGIQEGGELGIPNVRVVLRDRVTDAVLAVDITDANGYYLFEGLCLGDYTVEVDPTTLPGGMVESPNDQGGNDAADSDGVNHRAAVSLPADDTTDLTIDFGYYRNARLQLVKLTNGTDNNSPTGPLVPVGSLITWTYNVTSTGSTEPIANVAVADDNGTPGNPADDFLAIFSGGDSNGNGLLDVGETWTFIGTGVATAGQYGNVGTATGSGSFSGSPVSATDPDHYLGVVGLQATKTAAGTFTRTVGWTLTKTVDPSSYTGTAGQTLGTSTWSVTATKSVTLSNYQVTGTISVTNPNPFAVNFSVADQLNDGTAGSVSCPTTTAAAGATVVCSYTASPSGASATSNTATITSLTSDVAGTTASAAVAFTATTVGDDTVTLGDVKFSYSQSISGSSAPTFPETFTCPSTGSSYTNGVYTNTVTNTATLVGASTNLSANASVNIRCTTQSLQASKTAAGRFTRTVGWTLRKTVNPSSYSGAPGQTLGTSTWSVTATKNVTLSGYQVTGTISVTNPNAFAVNFSVSDQLNDGTVGSVSCPATSVGAGATVVCTYTANPSGGSATSNTATITALTGGVGGTTASAAVAFTGTTVGDDTVTLGDVKFSYSQSISGSSAPTFPETFTCPSTASSYTNGVYTRTVTNTATLVGPSTNLSASASVNIRCEQQWGNETAVGAGTPYPNSSNWFMYSRYTTSKVDLIAGQVYDAGDIYFTRTGSGANARTVITITLATGFRWANVAEVLKIQPFSSAPTTYLEPGSFQYKFTAPNISNIAGATVSFSGQTVTVSLPGQVNYYGIHGAVQRLLP